MASLERYSKHPLARAILAAAKADGIPLPEATEVSEPPGQGLRRTVSGRQVQITSRSQLGAQFGPKWLTKERLSARGASRKRRAAA